MPIKKGNTTIGAIYKGTTQIAKVYKGTKLLFENAVWLDYYFSNLYHSLVPETISSKSVKNKAKISKIYGNGVVENQLNDNALVTTTQNGITVTNNNNGSFTFSGTASAQTEFELNSYAHRLFTVVGHKYLIVALGLTGQSSSTYDIRVAGVERLDSNGTIAKIANCTSSNNYIVLMVRNGAAVTTPVTFFAELIDLTLMFGTGNEPTSLTDHRIQALLNRGYIPYNAGTYKPAIVEELVMEPYNLFDLDRSQGTLSGYSNTTPRAFEEGKYYLGMTRDGYYYPSYITSYSISSNSLSITSSAGGYGIAFPIKILPNRQYAFEGTADNGFLSAVGFYDKDGIYISNFYGNDGGRKTTRNDTFTTPSNAYWAVILMYPPDTNTQYTFSNLCLHETNYNLFDGKIATDNKYVGSDGSLVDSTNFAVSDYFAISGGKSCVVKNVSGSNPAICFYDKNKNYISGTAYDGQTTVTVTAPNKACFARISIYKANITTITLWCNRTGYAPHQTFTPIALKYQGNGALNAHDTMEITKDNVVFVKNIGSYTFSGSETWNSLSNDRYYCGILINSVKKPASNSAIANFVYSKLTTQSSDYVGDHDNCSAIQANGNFVVRNSALITSTATAASYTSGSTIYYELATPQTITIPRKYMGVVDLGTLTWITTTAEGHRVFLTTDVRTGNNYSVYTNKYLYNSGAIADKQIRNDTYFGPDYLYIVDDSYSNVTDFTNAMQGVYLFYETSAETTDIAETLDIEAGGTITSDSEVLPNVEFSVKCK